MACTIVSTPATGAADWTGWITQQGLTDRGFMQVSLTNFATTVASLIGTGSVFELAGSIYSCTETAISLAAGTASADVAVYYVAIPSAGGTTCTFTMDSVAPTWVDAKQGYYASAASTSRYLGGNYIGTAGVYYRKWLYGWIGGVSAVRATNASAQSLANASYEIITYDTVVFDSLGEYDNVTNYNFTAKETGYYLINAALVSASVQFTSAEAFIITIYKNGTRYSVGGYDTAGATVTRRRSPSITDIVYLTVGEYVDIRGYQSTGIAMALEGDETYNYFSVHKLI